MSHDDDLERAIGDWLVRKESAPDLLPGEFARQLPPALRSAFLAELEALAEIDQLASLAPSRDLPRRYGDFRVLGELGRGAMGAVFDAEQVSSGRRVALKVMHGHVARDLQSAARFRREARTAASLQHPGIVPVLEFGETDGTAWLAMARIDGRSLQRLLAAIADPRDVDHERARTLLHDPRRLAQAMADAADALDFAHRHNVVHRDVKPANLMATDDGHIVVLDFGLASARDADAATLTRAGDFLGTPLYMAPEQAKGAENGIAQSDVHALGAVLYECLCGRPPVAPGPLAEVIDKILNHEPVDCRRVRHTVPDALARIAMQCLEKDPRHRYPTAAALADDLRRFVDGGSVVARRGGPVRRSLRRLWRRPQRAALLAAAAVLMLFATGAIIVSLQRSQQLATLERRAGLARATELLSGSPERLTAFGGASRRYYARLGLGEQIGTDSGRSPAARAALQMLEALAAQHPADLDVLRARAVARLDVGDDAEATGKALTALILADGATAGDRMMAAVWQRQNGDGEAAARLRNSVDAEAADPDVAYWLAFWCQDEQDHAAAITMFSRALASRDLGTEQRYWALLHRGWCRTCPDVCQLRAAEDDLLQAAALRPRHGTARLLWAALRVLEAEQAKDLAEPVAAVTDVLRDADPWVHVLAARVLLALAEGGVVQDGPVTFGAEFSPIAVLPIQPAFGAALAGLGLQLLDGIAADAPVAFEARFHRITALALDGRHADALAACDALQASAPPGRRAILDVQRARVHLAAGDAQRATDAVRRALAADSQLVVAWRFEGLLAAHVGDRQRQLTALEHAVRHLQALRHATSVFPDAAAMLPEMQLERARVLHLLQRDADASELLRHGDFGGVLAGERSPRVVRQRRALGARVAAGTPAEPVALVPAADDSPMRWLEGPTRTPPTAVEADVRAALRRDWLPAAVVAALPADASIQLPLQARGVVLPGDAATAPLEAVLPNVAALLGRAGEAERLLARAEALLAADPDHGEARVLRALLLQGAGRRHEAAKFLAGTLSRHDDDLRARYLQAMTALASDDQPLLRQALARTDTPWSARELDLAATTLPLAAPVAGAALLTSAQ